MLWCLGENEYVIYCDEIRGSTTAVTKDITIWVDYYWWNGI